MSEMLGSICNGFLSPTKRNKAAWRKYRENQNKEMNIVDDNKTTNVIILLAQVLSFAKQWRPVRDLVARHTAPHWKQCFRAIA